MGAEPKFFNKNFIDPVAVLAASTGAAVVDRVRDRDNELQWVSVGSNDATVETIQADFKSGGLDFLRTFDFLAVLNHNMKDFKFQHDIGAGFVDTPGAATTTETATFTLFPISAIASAKSIKLVMNTTQIANQEKKVGEILVLKRLLEFPADEAFAGYDFDFRPVAKVTPMLDDGRIVNQLRWAGNRVERYVASMAFELLPKTVYDSLRTVVKNGRFVIQPEPDERPDEFFFVTAVEGGFPARYSGRSTKAPGYTLNLSVREV